MNVTSTPAPKWLNMCWDSFRHVDNHNKSHIFQPRLSRTSAVSSFYSKGQAKMIYEQNPPGTPSNSSEKTK